MVLDTGSAGSVFSADELAQIGILPGLEDKIHRVRGVGGFEFVYSKRIESIALGTMRVDDFEIQVGAMQYGFPLQGIVGMDFLLDTKAIVDLESLDPYMVPGAYQVGRLSSRRGPSSPW
ncbi:MAG: clan AA aspartic protease [bacterium]|nr:clan AA aspartic protease [bacterium]